MSFRNIIQPVVNIFRPGLAPKLPNNNLVYLDGSGNWTSPSGGVGGGGLVLVEQHTAAVSASLDFTTGITSSYDDYLFELIDILPATNNVSLTMIVSTNGGSTYDTGTNYATAYFRWSKTGTGVAGAASDTNFNLITAAAGSLNNDATEQGLSGSVKFFNPLGTAGWKKITGQMTWWFSGTGSPAEILGATLSGAYKSATAVNAVRFIMSAGNITSGTIRLYALTK